MVIVNEGINLLGNSALAVELNRVQAVLGIVDKLFFRLLLLLVWPELPQS